MVVILKLLQEKAPQVDLASLKRMSGLNMVVMMFGQVHRASQRLEVGHGLFRLEFVSAHQQCADEVCAAAQSAAAIRNDA